MSFPKCVACIAQFVEAKANAQVEMGCEFTEEEAYEPAELWAKVRDADTILVSWEKYFHGNQMVVSPVATPTCMAHVGIRKPDIQEIATRSGLALPT